MGFKGEYTNIYFFRHIGHCVKSVCIRSSSGPYFPAFGMNTERYGVSFHIQSECGKIRTRKTPNTDTFDAVSVSYIQFVQYFHAESLISRA